jgi:hypothetical protein
MKKSQLNKLIREEISKVLKEEQMGSYRKFLKVVKSYEDEEILTDFLNSYPKGEDISKSEYEKFTEKHFDEPDPEDYRGKNWKYIMTENTKKKKKTQLDKLIKEEISKTLNENVEGSIENAFQNWLDEMSTKFEDEKLTLKTVIDYAQYTLKDYAMDDWVPGQSLPENYKK